MPVKIEIGKPYTIVDYEGNILPGKWVPLKKRTDSQYYDTRTPQGGICQVKASEFIKKVTL